MRMIVFFDLPVQTKTERRHATAFRNFLLKDGYHMLQFSVYARVCNGNDAVKKHESLEGILAAKRLHSPACRYRKAVPVYSDSSGKLSAGRSPFCM